MIRIIFYAFFISLALNIQAKDFTLAHIASEGKTCDVHVRSSATDWQLVWAYTDSNNFTVARVHKNTSYADDIAGWISNFTLVRVVSGNETIITERNFTSDSADFSVRLVCDMYGFNIFVADGENLNDFASVLNEKSTLPSPLIPNSEIRYVSTSGAMPSILSVGIDYYPAAQRSHFIDTQSLCYYLENSEDPIEGLWQYLDRDLVGNEVQLGGQYTIAIVRTDKSDTDSYDMIYLAGADDSPALWQAFNIKGKLQTTPFINIYDAIWFDSTRQTHDKSEEVNARIENSIMTMTFPLLNSSIRFVRHPPKSIRSILNKCISCTKDVI